MLSREGEEERGRDVFATGGSVAQARHPSNESSCTVSEEMWLKALKGKVPEKKDPKKKGSVGFRGRAF